MSERLGIAVIGLGGAVATTAAAGIETIRKGWHDMSGLPLAKRDTKGMTAYEDIHFAGWDLSPDDLSTAATRHGVLDDHILKNGASSLGDTKPWAAVGSRDFCANIGGTNALEARGHRAAVERLQMDLTRFREDGEFDRVVVLNLASTERRADPEADALQSIEGFERGLDTNDGNISPAMLYAYAAIDANIPYGNFTPSVAADVKPLADLAAERNVPIAGKDGKTGQTLLKTVIAPALRDRALHVDGWFSTNILGNSDGLALDDPKSLESKLETKKSVLNDILGYPVDDHIVMIHYYRPRGDDKEAWDNVDVTGFLGQRMQLKLNFLCKDSVLAAPLAIEIARCLGLAQHRGEGGVQEQLGVFFKSPQTRGSRPVHDFFVQQAAFDAWLDEE